MFRHVLIDRCIIAVLAVAVCYLVVTGRQHQAHRNDALRVLVCFAENAGLAHSTSTNEKSAVLQFWQGYLTAAHIGPPCGH